MTPQLPGLVNQVALLAIKMESERLDTLKDNEEHVAKGGVESDSDDEDEGDDGQIQEGDDAGETKDVSS